MYPNNNNNNNNNNNSNLKKRIKIKRKEADGVREERGERVIRFLFSSLYFFLRFMEIGQ